MSTYALARANTATAKAEYNAASVTLENARIRERLAEITEQHEPLHSFLGKGMDGRDMLIASAFYVVVGRWPE